MISLAICDDNRLHSNQIEEQLEAFQSTEGITLSVDIYEDPQRLLTHYQPGSYQLLLLDIEMPALSGLELAQAIRQQDPNVLILFLTSHIDFMPQVFQVETFDFLVKPVDQQKLFSSLRRAIQRLLQQEKRISFTSQHQQYALPSQEIFYIEKDGRTALLHTSTRIYPVRKSIKELRQDLPDDFVQIHNSYFINIRYFYKLEEKWLYLRLPQSQEKVLPVSRHYKKLLKEQILERLRKYYGLD